LLQNGDVALMTEEGVAIYHDEKPVAREITVFDWDADVADIGDHEHFMIKEIMEQPWAIGQTLHKTGRIAGDKKSILLPELDFSDEYLRGVNKISIVACGTAYHAGLVGKYVLEKFLRLPVEVDIASEFRCRAPLIDEHTLAVIISQSGETADTLGVLRECKRRGAKILSICNVLGSTISVEADYVINTYAGPEIAVASTKAYITQLIALYLFSFYLAERLGKITPTELERMIAELEKLPSNAQKVIEQLAAPMEKLGKSFVNKRDVFFIGRGLDYAVALEGALKLKEISYIRAEAYAAGELKHGSIALIEKDIPVFAIATQKDNEYQIIEKTIGSVAEVKARKAYVISICTEGENKFEQISDEIYYLPVTDDLLMPALAVIPLQLLSYYASVARGCNVDKPRNLAKSVTVF